MFTSIRFFLLRVFLRRTFMSSRLMVYEALHDMLTNNAGTKAPTFAARFDEWAKRARARDQAIWRPYAEIQRRLASGRGLARSMAPFIPADEVMILDAGEASGQLVPTFKAIIKGVEVSQDIEQATRAAYREPFIGLLSFIALSVFSGFAVWPAMIESLPERYWDGWALALIYAQIYMFDYTWVLLLMVGFYIGYRYSLGNWAGRGRGLAEKLLPFYASYRDKQAASLLMVLAGLLRAGKTLDQALVHISRQGTPYVRWHTKNMQRRLQLFAGDPAKMLATGIFSDEILDRIANAGAARQLAESIQVIGTTSIDGVGKSVKKAAVIGASVLFMFIGLLMTYYTAVQVIGSQMASDRFMNEVKASSGMR